MKIKVGCDPELFLQNPNSGAFISAYGKIPGTKEQPHKVNKGAVQVDGMALEFNIDPAETVGEFIYNVRTVYDNLKLMVPGYNVIAEPVAVFPEEYFKHQPACSKMLGCEPDYDAYAECSNFPPNNKRPMRTAAGHIHLGWSEDGEEFDPYSIEHWETCVDMARHLDYYLGIYSLFWDSNQERRTMYGKAGCFRPKPYGIEYRTLSNAWLKDTRLMGWVFTAAKRAVEDFFVGISARPYNKWGKIGQTIINENIIDWQDKFPKVISSRVPRLPARLKA